MIGYSTAALIGAAGGVVCGLYAGIRALITSISENIDFTDKPLRHNDEEPARMPYLFGVGHTQLFRTLSDSFINSSINALSIISELEVHDTRSGFLDNCIAVCFRFLAFFIRVVAFITELLLCFAFGTLYLTVLSIMSFGALLILGFVWSADRLYINLRKIDPVCTNCGNSIKTPCYVCPICGARHFKLYPSFYGIWHHTCQCNEKMASTIFNGRSDLSCICTREDCGADILSSNSRQFSLQLVGGTTSGKSAR